MQMKNVGQRIGNLPALGQSGLNVEVLVARQQRVEEEFVDALRLPVDAHARIEIRGAALDDHDQRVGVGRLRAGEKREDADADQQKELSSEKQLSS